MAQYPIEFHAKTAASCGMQTKWQSQSQDQSVSVSIPPEFQGPGGAFSPEDLFSHALTNCFVGTFKVFAENSKLTFESLQVESKLIVDLDEKKRPVMKEFFLKAKIQAPSNEDKARLLAKKATETGFILNSVKTLCHFDVEIIP